MRVVDPNAWGLNAMTGAGDTQGSLAWYESVDRSWDQGSDSAIYCCVTLSYFLDVSLPGYFHLLVITGSGVNK